MEALQGRLSQNRQWHIHASPVPLLKHLGTNCFESPFQPKGGWIVHYETTKRKHSTGHFNVHFLSPKVLLFYWALRRCLLHRLSISLVSLPHRGKKINKKVQIYTPDSWYHQPPLLKLPPDGFTQPEHTSSFTPLVPRGGSLSSTNAWKKPRFMQVHETSSPECRES